MNWRTVDMSRESRRDQFAYFQTLSNPYVGVTVQVDVTELAVWCRERGTSFFLAMLYAAVRAANGVPELLHGLAARGIMLGMVTNKTEATARCVMAHYFPEVPFRFIWGSNGVRPLKPAPESGELMLRELGLTPEQIAFIGDGDTDMAFASALGFWALGACWGYRPRTVLAEQGADALLETPEELQKLLLG